MAFSQEQKDSINRLNTYIVSHYMEPIVYKWETQLPFANNVIESFEQGIKKLNIDWYHLTDADCRTLGFIKSSNNLYAIPLAYINILPKNLKVYSIFSNKEYRFGDVTDFDNRSGVIAYGVKVSR